MTVELKINWFSY